MKCTHCSKEINDGFKYCNFCGAEVIKEVTCANCKTILPEGSNFCGVCGTSLKQSVIKSEEIMTERLRGYDIANNATYGGWVNEYNGYVYLFVNKGLGDNLWKMKEDGSERSKIYKGSGTCLNVNKHGVFFIQAGEIVHLDLDGKYIGKFSLKKFNGWQIFVYDDRIYFGDQDTDKARVYVSSCKIDGSDFKTLAKISCNKGRYEGDCQVNKISSDGKIVVFYVYDELENATGWYKVDVNGENLTSIKYSYQEVYDDGEIEDVSLDILHIDVEQRIAYTHATDIEEKYYELRSGQGVIKRSLDAKFDKRFKGELSAVMRPNGYVFNDDFGGYYDRGDIYFNGKVSYGFTYSHQGKNKEHKSYYYNLYKLNETGEAIFLNAGSRGGIEELTIAGEYAYFDRQFSLRVKLDGSDFVDMGSWFKLYGLDITTHLDIPGGIRTIDSDDTGYCEQIESVHIPNSVIGIGYAAFAGCKNLRSISIPESVTSIINNAFEGCKSLESIKLPESINFIGMYAFKDCASLKRMVVPSEIKQLSYGAFSGCINLEEIVLQEGLELIDSEVFKKCISLEKVRIPKSVEDFGLTGLEELPNVVVEVFENTPAHRYVEEEHIPYKIIG